MRLPAALEEIGQAQLLTKTRNSANDLPSARARLIALDTLLRANTDGITNDLHDRRTRKSGPGLKQTIEPALTTHLQQAQMRFLMHCAPSPMPVAILAGNPPCHIPLRLTAPRRLGNHAETTQSIADAARRQSAPAASAESRVDRRSWSAGAFGRFLDLSGHDCTDQAARRPGQHDSRNQKLRPAISTMTAEMKSAGWEELSMKCSANLRLRASEKS